MEVKTNTEDEFSVINDDGESLTFQKICQIDTTDEHKSYLVYTDGSVDESGFTAAYASMLDSTNESLELLPIETDEEWEIIEKFLYEMEDKKEDFE